MTNIASRVSVVVGAVLIAAAYLSFIYASEAKASAPSGLAAATTNATSSNPTVGTSGVLIIATSTTCSARIITTVASPVMLTFSDNQGKVPTALYGHLQAASTTVAYDSGLYGCGAVKAYGFVSSAISVTETY